MLKYVKVCEVFECSERSLKRWVERYDKNKNVNRKTRKLGSYKLEKQHIQFIKDTLRNRLIDFLEQNITSKLRNKLIILDNASSHRNEK